MIVGTNRWRRPPAPALAALIEREGLLVDTAEVYQRGRSEAAVGAGLPTAPVMTKIMPWLWRSPRHFGRHLRRSLARLRRPSVSVLVLHFPARRGLRRWLDQLAAAVHGGYAEAVGLSNHSPAQLDAASAHLAAAGVPLRAVQAELSLRHAAPLWSGLKARLDADGVELMAFRIFGAGALFGQDAPRPVAAACRRTGATPAQVSLAWLRHHGVTPIVGLRSAAHLREALGAREVALSAEELDALDRLSRRSSGW